VAKRSPLRAGLERRTVVEAAVQLADERGLAGLSLTELAARLGVKTPSLYNHIAGQADLERELAIEAGRRVHAAFSRAAVGRSGDDAVRAIAHAYRAFAHAHPGLYPLLLAAPAAGDEEAQAVALAVVDVVRAVIAGYGLAGDDALHAVRALRSVLHGFVSLESVGGFGMPLDLDESWARLVELLLAGLRARSA
jgi:AcrR family transcriptional regulator